MNKSDALWQDRILDTGLGHLVLVTLGYCVFAGLIYGFEQLGRTLGQSGWGILGLGMDVGLLTAAVVWLARRSHPLAGSLGPLLALLLVVLLFASADALWQDLEGGFWSLRNLRTVAMQTSPVAVAALGMTVIIIGGGIDLSAGTCLALCATTLAYCLDVNTSVATAIVTCIATGVLAGMVNGLLISWLRVVPFIITLGTMTVFLGVAKLIANETTVRPPYERIPAWLPQMVAPVPKPEWISWPLLPNFAWGVWLALGLALLLAIVLKFSVLGRHVFALGSNEATARLCGVKIGVTKVALYAIGGFFVGIAGMYQFARLSSGNPTSGLGLELKIIAAVVIGGGSLSGGRGSVVGTLTGAAIMVVIASGCTALGLQNPIQDIIIGAIIVAAVAVDQYRQSKLAA